MASSTTPDNTTRYYWLPVQGTKKWSLYVNDNRLGLYDPETNIYRRVDTQGNLSEPAPRPWEDSPSASSIASNTVAAAGVMLSERLKSDGKVVVEEVQGIQNQPWFPYAIGGGVAGFFLIVALAVQLRH